jgi:hypothetical protein
MRGTVLIALAMLATGASSTPAMPGWLSGCWLEQKGPSWTEECWTGPRADQMMGSERDGRDDRVKSWETTQIERGPDGGLIYYGSMNGGERVGFKMISSGAREIVFANPQHDYPQRIRYWREGMQLKAEISQMDGSQKYGWTYNRLGTN